MGSRTPIDNPNSLVITLSVMRGEKGYDISVFLDGNLQSEEQLKNLTTRAAELLWETHDLKSL